MSVSLTYTLYRGPVNNISTQHWLITLYYEFPPSFISDVVIGMLCANDADCQNVLSNTMCTSVQCGCAAGFSGLGIL